jgi:hypothetical protein
MPPAHWSAIGWLAWYEEAGQVVLHDSRDGWTWEQLPDTGWLAFRVFWDEEWKTGSRYSDVLSGEWLIRERIDGKERWRNSLDVADPGGDRKQGIEISNPRWAALEATFNDPAEARR